MEVRIAGIVKHSSVDGPGVRLVIFFQGCPHHCKGCHNPNTWDYDGGESISIDKLIDIVNTTKYIDGITLSGGEPMSNPQVVKLIADAAHNRGLDVWCYTGYTLDQLLLGEPQIISALKSIDVLVDGRFIEDQKSPDCIYRGSSNQRIIHIKNSISIADL